MITIHSNFAKTLAEAEAKYHDYKNDDPFPNIDSALLNSAHIQAYIAKTGMVFPYTPADKPKDEMITSASMIMTIGPEALYWDENGNQKYYNELTESSVIPLRPNSITFLRPREHFFIPDYIAIRFNLRIVHVHRGLLLGTGPILDPGFKGYPMIPVHNLTSNEYCVRVGEEFINVEFTKISDIKSKISVGEEYIQELSYFKNRKKTFNFNFTKYIDKNVPNKKVKSSMSSVLDEGRVLIEKQKNLIKFSYIAILIAIVGLAYSGYQLTMSSTALVQDARTSIDSFIKRSALIDNQQIEIEKLKIEIEKLKKTDLQSK